MNSKEIMSEVAIINPVIMPTDNGFIIKPKPLEKTLPIFYKLLKSLYSKK